MIFEQFHYNGDRSVEFETKKPLRRQEFEQEFRRLVIDPVIPSGGYSGRVVQELQAVSKPNEGHDSFCGDTYYYGRVYRSKLRRLIIERI